jgi:hypothetical protein
MMKEGWPLFRLRSGTMPIASSVYR